jgi:hypothetical protein
MAQSNNQFHLGQARKDTFLGGAMQRQIFNSDHGLPGNIASRFGAMVAMAGLLLLSACENGKTVQDNNLAEPGRDGVPPTLTTVTIQPDGLVAVGQTVRIDFVASEALMTPTVYIGDARAEVTGNISEWRAVRRMTEADTLGEITFSIVYQDISGEAGEVVLTTTNGSVAEYCGADCPVDELGPLEGKWKLNTVDGAGVGPAPGDISWWNTNAAGVVDDRACWFDDIYEFDADGSFRNVQGDETWLEIWQGVAADSCGAPVAPHDGSNAAIFEYDEEAGTLKLTGQGAYLGLAKAVNGAELGDPASAPGSVTYDVLELIDNNLTITIDTAGDGSAWWTFNLTRISNYPVVGKWKLATEDGAGVGPVAGDISWWSTNAGGVVEARACWFDDIYHIGDDGSFQNYQGGETWLETWQGVAEESCGAPVAPHDGSSAGAWVYDDVENTLTLEGLGSFLGLAKAVNGAELADPAAAPDSVTYDVLEIEGDMMRVTIDTAGDGSAWWTFTLERATDTADLRGKWQLNTDSGAGVGPVAGDISWWNTNAAGVVEDRACWFDDVFNFGRDGSFANEQGDETWLEVWQGVAADSCGAPVAPHDGSARAIYDYDADAGTLTVYGTGAHLGLAKAVNGQELADPASAPEFVVYDVLSLAGNDMSVTIDTAGDGSAWWTFNLVRTSGLPMVGNWKLDGEGAAGVGPVAGDISWWSTSAADVETRACWFDDVFHFGGDGTFRNFQDGETWLETWQGVAEEGCGTPVAPHDGSSAGKFVYDSDEQTLTLLGTGSHLGLAKAVNGAELADPAAAPESVTYDILDVEGGLITVTIDVAGDGSSWWTFRLAKD